MDGNEPLLDSATADLLARVGALVAELDALAGVSVRVDITVTVRMKANPDDE